MAPEVLQWLLADPDLKEHLGRATLASTQHPDQMCKRGMRHEFDPKLSSSRFLVVFVPRELRLATA